MSQSNPNLNWACEDFRETEVFLYLEIWIDWQGNKFVRKPHAKKIVHTYLYTQIIPNEC